MIKSLQTFFRQLLKNLSPRAHNFLFERRRVLRFLVAGGSAVAVNIAVLYVCRDVWGFTLNYAVAMGFMAGFCASFLLQKFWAFEDTSVEKAHTQAGLYFIVATVNFFLNLALMNLLVEIWGVWYILSQFLVSGLIACGSYFVYKHFIFSTK